jgi:hypothetical protein
VVTPSSLRPSNRISLEGVEGGPGGKADEEAGNDVHDSNQAVIESGEGRPSEEERPSVT